MVYFLELIYFTSESYYLKSYFASLLFKLEFCGVLYQFRTSLFKTHNFVMANRFHCQRCSNPIELDNSLLNLNTHKVNLLKNNRPTKFNDAYNHGSDTNTNDDPDPSHFISKDKLQFYESLNHDSKPIIEQNDVLHNEIDNIVSVSTSLTSNSFVMLSEDPEQTNDEDHEAANDSSASLHLHDEHPDSISNRLRILGYVFEILSNNNEIDHPLCQECSTLIIENYKLKFDQSQKEKEYYLSFLKKLKDQGDKINNEEAEVDPKLSEALNEYRKLQRIETEKLDELQQLEDTKQKLDEQLQQLDAEYDSLKSDELNSLLRLRNDLSTELILNTNKLNQTKSQYQLHLNHLDSLRSSNIYTQFFQISSDDNNKYGTINGFRLGYRIPWGEINNALGQVVLLIIFLTKRLNMKLEGYKLVPMGSQSQIIKTVVDETATDTNGVGRSVLNLYSSNEFSLGKLFNFNKFDISMIALLDVLSQVQKKVKTLDSELDLPYRISSKKDTIGGKSIRITSNGEWTYSCKFMLTNLSWILAYTSVHTTTSEI